MINATSSNTQIQQIAYQPPAKHSAPSQASPIEDTVHLSSAAKSAMGDAARGDPDHDGH